MAYSNFTVSQVKANFGIITNETQDLLTQTEAIAPRNLLTLILKDQLPLASAINTEKARSELSVAKVIQLV